MFKVAESKDKEAIIKFYDEVIAANNTSKINLRWQKDVHPSHKLLETSADNGELFLWVENGEIEAALIMNKSHNEDYIKVQWKASDNDKVGIIHVLGVSPKKFRKGIGRKLLEGLIDYAKENEFKSIKLDVFKINIPAISLYEKVGFETREEVRMFVPKIGYEDFCLMEKVID